MNQKELLIISITVFLTVLGWIIADLNHVANTEQLPPHDSRFARPITIDINPEIFDILQERK